MRKAYSLPPHVMAVLFLVLLGTVVYFALGNKAMGKIAEYDPLESAAICICAIIIMPITRMRAVQNEIPLAISRLCITITRIIDKNYDNPIGWMIFPNPTPSYTPSKQWSHTPLSAT